jgi:8-oxo-dGTP pyrophosphatase MutT (NUDIX family)
LKKILLQTCCSIETEYYWPKGRSNNVESYYSTAIRETFEETGLDVSSFRKIDYLEDRYVGINNCIYINCLWHIDLQEKDWWRKGSGPKEEKTTVPFVTNKNSEIEISNAKWIHKDLLMNYLSHDKFLLIKKYL